MYLQKKVDGVQDVSQNAHHILCVSCVTAGVTRKDGIELIVKVTKWCVNSSPSTTFFTVLRECPVWRLMERIEWPSRFSSLIFIISSRQSTTVLSHDWAHLCEMSATTSLIRVTGS